MWAAHTSNNQLTRNSDLNLLDAIAVPNSSIEELMGSCDGAMNTKQDPKIYRCSVDRLTPLNHDTSRVWLTVESGGRLEFKAGQYLEIILPSGKHCPFSIACAPANAEHLELHIRPTPGSDDSSQIEDLIRKPGCFEINAPKGDCIIDHVPDQPLLLLAASTGITQMKSLLEFLFDGEISKPISLYWGIVAPDDLYLHDLCVKWTSKFPLFSYTPVLSEPEESPTWDGATGLLADAVVTEVSDLSNHLAYISGGPAMVQATAKVLLDNGLPIDNIRSDLLPYITLD
jgi:CDP-4-dehydro-6-deoxyglucose reductase|tara:strand:- start:2413 stop:3270 length:858 start_codon:yes stop_codon:yes gene_type:complete